MDQLNILPRSLPSTLNLKIHQRKAMGGAIHDKDDSDDRNKDSEQREGNHKKRQSENPRTRLQK